MRSLCAKLLSIRVHLPVRVYNVIYSWFYILLLLYGTELRTIDYAQFDGRLNLNTLDSEIMISEQSDWSVDT